MQHAHYMIETYGKRDSSAVQNINLCQTEAVFTINQI
jgi:hypothetical protein